MAEVKKKKNPLEVELEELPSQPAVWSRFDDARAPASEGYLKEGVAGVPVEYNLGGGSPQPGPRLFRNRPASLIEIPERKLQSVREDMPVRESIAVPNYLPTDREIDPKLLDQLFRLNQEAAQWSGNIGDEGEEAYRNPNRALLTNLLNAQIRERREGTFGDVAKKESVLGMPERMRETAVAGYTQAQADAEKQEAESQARFEKLFMEGQADKGKAAEKRRKLMESAAYSLMPQS